MFTVVVPLVFFSISSAIASMASITELWRVISRMFIVFILMGFVAAIYMLVVVKIYPPGLGVVLNLPAIKPVTQVSYGSES